MRGLILSGGKGTRLRPLTYTGAKQLVPVANKPVLWYGLEAMVKAGVTEIGIVISPETGDEIQQVTGNGDRFGAKLTYIRQDHPSGLAHAVKSSQDFLKDSPFVMYLGDNLICDDLERFIEQFKAESLDALILLRQVKNPRAFGVAEVDGQGKVLRLIEKPQNPPSNLALVGVYFFSPQVHDSIAQIQPSTRGELEITDAIQHLIDGQHAVQAEELQGWWLDTGKKDDMLEANRILLDERCSSYFHGVKDDQTQLVGRVCVGTDSQLVRCSIRGPVIIGRNCILEDCFVGPYSSIADGVVLRGVDIEHSVILEGAIVEGIDSRIVDSLIGRRAKLSRAPSQPKAYRFLLGDDSHIEIP